MKKTIIVILMSILFVPSFAFSAESLITKVGAYLAVEYAKCGAFASVVKTSLELQGKYENAAVFEQLFKESVQASMAIAEMYGMPKDDIAKIYKDASRTLTEAAIETIKEYGYDNYIALNKDCALAGMDNIETFVKMKTDEFMDSQ